MNYHRTKDVCYVINFLLLFFINILLLLSYIVIQGAAKMLRKMLFFFFIFLFEIFFLHTSIITHYNTKSFVSESSESSASDELNASCIAIAGKSLSALLSSFFFSSLFFSFSSMASCVAIHCATDFLSHFGSTVECRSNWVWIQCMYWTVWTQCCNIIRICNCRCVQCQESFHL